MKRRRCKTILTIVGYTILIYQLYINYIMFIFFPSEIWIYTVVSGIITIAWFCDFINNLYYWITCLKKIPT